MQLHRLAIYIPAVATGRRAAIAATHVTVFTRYTLCILVTALCEVDRPLQCLCTMHLRSLFTTSLSLCWWQLSRRGAHAR